MHLETLRAELAALRQQVFDKEQEVIDADAFENGVIGDIDPADRIRPFKSGAYVIVRINDGLVEAEIGLLPVKVNALIAALEQALIEP